MKIEKATYQDVSSLATIEQNTLRHYDCLDESKSEFASYLIPNTYVAKIEDEIIGFITLASYYYKETWIDMIAIKKAYRRKGIGRLLIQKVIQVAKQKDAKVLFVGSYKYFRAMNFYLKLGFNIIREDHDGLHSYRDFSIKIS